MLSAARCSYAPTSSAPPTATTNSCPSAWRWPLPLALAILVTVAITWAGLRFLHFQRFKPEPQLSADTLFNLLKIAFAVAAGIGGVVALVTAYRRQRITEMTERREGTRLFQRTVHHRRRPARARSLSGPPRRCLRHGRPSRRLARPAANMRRRALRLPADALQTQTRRRRPGRRPHYLSCEVPPTVIRVIKDHLQPGKTRAPTLVPWHGLDLDFTGVVFDGGDFRCVQFTGGEIDFTGAIHRTHSQLRQRGVHRRHRRLLRRRVR